MGKTQGSRTGSLLIRKMILTGPNLGFASSSPSPASAASAGCQAAWLLVPALLAGVAATAAGGLKGIREKLGRGIREYENQHGLGCSVVFC